MVRDSLALFLPLVATVMIGGTGDVVTWRTRSEEGCSMQGRHRCHSDEGCRRNTFWMITHGGESLQQSVVKHRPGL